MALTTQEVEHIADLARLALRDEEIALFRQQLSQILEYFEQLQVVDTSHISPTASVSMATSRLRSDIARSGLQIEKLLRDAPQVEDNQFRVPPVLE